MSEDILDADKDPHEKLVELNSLYRKFETVFRMAIQQVIEILDAVKSYNTKKGFSENSFPEKNLETQISVWK